MPRRCSVCTHEKRDSVDKALVDHRLSYRQLASNYGLSLSAMYRHARNHIPEILTKAHNIKEVAHADVLRDRIERLVSQSEQLLEHGRSKERGVDWAAGLRELRKSYELLARVSGELDERPQINLIATEQWIEIRTRLIAVLGAYPEAKRKVIEVLNADTKD